MHSPTPRHALNIFCSSFGHGNPHSTPVFSGVSICFLVYCGPCLLPQDLRMYLTGRAIVLSFHIPQAFHTEPMKCAPGVFAIPQPWSNWVHLEGEQGTGGAERERTV